MKSIITYSAFRLRIAFLGLCILTSCSNTKYPPGFSDTQFDYIKIGMTEEEVYRIAGPPLDRFSYALRHDWIYGRDPGPKVNTAHSSGPVGSIEYKVPAESEYTIISFDRQGVLTMQHGSKLDLRLLSKCISTSDVLHFFGPPNTIETRLDSRRLVYSLPIRDGDFNLRAVKLDKNGRVTAVSRERWHD